MSFDLEFAEDLYDYYVRAERAQGMRQPSPFLQSLGSYITLQVAGEMIGVAQHVVQAGDMLAEIRGLKAQADDLAIRIRKTRDKVQKATYFKRYTKLLAEAEDYHRGLVGLENGF